MINPTAVRRGTKAPSWRTLFAATAVAAILACNAHAHAQASTAKRQIGAPSLMGKITAADGKPLGGVAVTAQESSKLFKTTVYTDAQGAYIFPHLSSGDYKVLAQAIGFMTERTDTTFDVARTTNHDFRLKTLADFDAQMTGADWINSLPEDTLAHSRAKQVMYVACTGCHGVDVIMNNKFDEVGWRAVIKAMESADYNGYRGGDDIPNDQLGWEGQIIRHHREDLVKLLTEMRGPAKSPMVLKPLPRPEGDAARVVITQYDIPAPEKMNEASWYHGDDWMKGPSTGMHGTIGVHDVIADASGKVWITQSRTTFETNRSLVKMDPETGEMEVYRLFNPEGRQIQFEQISQPDPRGMIWMHGGGSVIKLDPSKSAFTAYPIPRPFGGTQNSIDPDSIGRVFVNGKYGTVALDPSLQDTKDVMYPGWHLYQQRTPGNGTTYGIGADSENNPWWSESYSDIVATKNLRTGKVTEFPMHDPDYDARKALMTPEDLAFYDSFGGEIWANTSGNPLPYGEMPRRLSADKHGDTVWVPNWAQSNLAEINIHTMKVTYHQLPFKTHPYKTTVDKNHNVYTDTQVADGMFKFVPSTQKWTFYQIPTHGCSSRHMSFDDYKGEAWIPCDQANVVDRIQFRTVQQMKELTAAVKY